MDNYFHITDGTIDEGPRILPNGWRNISGLHHLNPAKLKSHGWLPEEKVGYEPLDQTTQVREGPVYKVTATKVKSVYTIRDRTKDELIEDVRQRRAKEYGPVGDQLDMQYWDSVNGTTTWKDHIAKVKSDNPKPS